MTLAARRDKRGFTLIELVLVLAVLGLSATVVLPVIERGLKNRSARKAALGFAAVARDLGSRARAEGVPKRLVVSPLRNSYFVARDVEIPLPRDMAFAGIEGGELLENGVRRFSFFPNGATYGGSVAFAAEGDGVLYTVRMHPLTGRVEVRGGAGR